MSNQTCQTPFSDLAKDAIDHYEEAASKIFHWSSSIPIAIRYYFCDKIIQQAKNNPKVITSGDKVYVKEWGTFEQLEKFNEIMKKWTEEDMRQYLLDKKKENIDVTNDGIRHRIYYEVGNRKADPDVKKKKEELSRTSINEWVHKMKEIPVDIISDREKGMRFNNGKLRWGLVPFSALEGMVKVLEYGCLKYSPHNWKKGLSVIQICESLQRHLYAFLEGEDIDEESGLHHKDHILCNALFLSWMLENKPEFDDRHKGI